METVRKSRLIVDQELAPKFAEIYSFLQLFHLHLEIAPVGLADLEEFFGEGYEDFKSPAVLAHWRLLKGIGKRGNLFSWQSTAVKFARSLGMISEKTAYGTLSREKRLDIFKCTCDSQFDYNLKFKLEVNKLPAELLRMSPIGLDMDGNRHWFFQDHKDGVCLYSDGHYQQFPVQPSSCTDYCRTVDELSHCINQLEAEVFSMCNRRMCNGEMDDNGSGSLVGCMKCYKDTEYDRLLLCDECNGECHMYCLYPPLYAVPSGTWSCPHCNQKHLIVRLKMLLFEAEAVRLRHQASKEKMKRKVDRLARSGLNCGNIIMSDFIDDDGLRRSRRSRTTVNYADLCDLDLTPIEERRIHKRHESKLVSRAARYDILLEKRGLTTSDAESSSKESYFSEQNNETTTENCYRTSDSSGSEYEELYEPISKPDYIDGALEYPLQKKTEVDDSSNADDSLAEQCV